MMAASMLSSKSLKLVYLHSKFLPASQLLKVALFQGVQMYKVNFL